MKRNTKNCSKSITHSNKKHKTITSKKIVQELKPTKISVIEVNFKKQMRCARRSFYR